MTFNQQILPKKNWIDVKHVPDVQHIPSQHYETTRRKIASGVTELWFYLRAELGDVLQGLEVLDREEKRDQPQYKSPENMTPAKVLNMATIMGGSPVRKPVQQTSDSGVKEMISKLSRVLEDGADRQRYLCGVIVV